MFVIESVCTNIWASNKCVCSFANGSGRNENAAFFFFGLALKKKKKLSSETDLLVIDDNRLACSIKKSDKLGKSIAEKLQVFSTTKF